MPVTPTTAFKFDTQKSPMQTYLEDVYTISVNLAGLGVLVCLWARIKKGLISQPSLFARLMMSKPC